jgi:transcriptional regulator with XRE-family HTH domain
MKKGHFDSEAFFAALDAVRVSMKINWKEVARGTGVSASTLTRMAQGRRPDVDGLAALCLWSGLKADDFIFEEEGQRREATPIAMISTYLRADPNLTKEGAIALEQVIKATYEQMTKGQISRDSKKRIQERGK